MKLVELVRIVDGGEMITLKDRNRNRIVEFECDDLVDSDRSRSFSVVHRDTDLFDPALLDCEVVVAFIEVDEEYGLPGLTVILERGA